MPQDPTTSAFSITAPSDTKPKPKAGRKPPRLQAPNLQPQALPGSLRALLACRAQPHCAISRVSRAIAMPSSLKAAGKAPSGENEGPAHWDAASRLEVRAWRQLSPQGDVYSPRTGHTVSSSGGWRLAMVHARWWWLTIGIWWISRWKAVRVWRDGPAAPAAGSVPV